ncbi:MAG TPA: gephyrin-like molybdotransferase Glp [Longimicrobiaceae bacterium]
MAERRADWLSVTEARERVLAGVAPLPPERRPLEDSLGYALAETITSPIDLPPWHNSAMDGYAVRADDVRGASEQKPVVLRLIDDVPAGGFARHSVSPGTAIRVMTGAPVPDGADTVVRVEHTDGAALAGDEARVRIFRDDDAGRNVRLRGEDLRHGATVLEAGTRLNAAALGAAASVGKSHLFVHRRPVVAIASSGDELVEVDRFDEVLAGRKIVASNGYSLAAQLRESGMGVRHLGIGRDDPQALRELLLGARGCDALITTAGISVGAHDHTRAVLESLGVRVEFWRVKIKPGSPVAFGWVDGLGGIPWFGLPGNPVSAMVTFELFVRPALLRMAGHEALFLPTKVVRVTEPYRKSPGLTHFVRVRLGRVEDGCVASLTGNQGSGILSSMAAAHALLVVPEESDGIAAGNHLRAIVLGGAPLRRSPGY